MMALKITGLYMLVGIIYNLFELIRGKIYHPEEFKEFEADMREFTLFGQFIMALLYIIIWPWMLIGDSHERMSKLYKKDKD